MKKLFVIGIAALALASCGNKGGGSSTAKPESFEDKLSYSVGYDVTRSLKKMDVKLNKDMMMKGIMDALSDSTTKPLLTDEEMELVFQDLNKKNMQTQQQKQADMAAPNRSKGQEYASKMMGEDPAYKKSNSGLVYKAVKEGAGKKPTPQSVVKVKYVGSLINGTVFDQSEDATFEVGGVIPGWTEALQMMSEGANYKLIIPAELAYGNNPPPGTPIEPGSTLLFDVTLIKIEK